MSMQLYWILISYANVFYSCTIFFNNSGFPSRKKPSNALEPLFETLSIKPPMGKKLHAFELLSPSFFFSSLPLSTLYLLAHASFDAFILLDFPLAFVLLDFQLAFIQTYYYSIVGRFPTTGSD
jgi:hypothetical protein